MKSKIELGSEFNLSLNELSVVENNLFSYLGKYKTEWFDYGRSAVRHIPIHGKRKILLPEFICESVILCFPREDISFYRIDEKLQIDLSDLVSKLDESVGAIYVVHYFGYLQDPRVLQIIRDKADMYGCIVIEDTTQSLFSEHIIYGDYVIASVRKWMPVPQGAVLYASNRELPSVDGIPENTDNTRAYGMILKEMFLKTGYDTNAKYREIFSKCEKLIDSTSEVKCISQFARYIIGCIDVKKVIEKRKINYNRLRKGLQEKGLMPIKKLDADECPLAYVVRVNNRDEFRNYLMKNRIYCAVHWPFDGIKKELRCNAIDNSNTLLSLPIDQRYGNIEIDYMIDIICKYGGELSF